VSWGEVAVAVLAVAIGFFAKGVTGIGGPLLAIPVLAGFTGVEYAVVVIAIPTFLANCWLLWVTRDSAAGVAWFLKPMLAAGVVGTAIGAWILTTVDERYLSITLAALIAGYSILYFAKADFRLSEKAAKRLAAPAGFFGGWLAGATGIAAPIIGTYVHALGVARTAFIFAVTLPFWTLGAVQLISYTALGAYDASRVVAGLVATIPTLAVLPLATRTGDRMSHKAFQVAVLAVLGAAAVRLVISVL
jgi:uncharacterized membrane protein YfcA